MVDFGIQVIWPAGKHDALPVVFLDPFQDLFPLDPDVPLALFVFPGSFFNCLSYFLLGDPMFLEHQGQFPDQKIIIIVRKERMREYDTRFRENIIHIFADHFRIGGHDRAVVMIMGTLVFRPFIVDARIENPLDIMPDQPFDVPVDQLGRIACGIGADGFHAAFIDTLGGLRRKHHPIAQAVKESKPERIILVHIEDPGYAYHSSGFVLCLWLVIKYPLEFILKQIRDVPCDRCFALPFFTTVSGYEYRPAVEFVYGEKAVVFTMSATAMGVFNGKGIQFVQFNNLGLPRPVISFQRHQRRSVCSHDSRYIGPDDIPAHKVLYRSEHGIVQERPALNHDFFAGFIRISQFDHFI